MIDRAWCRMMAAYNSEMNRRLYGAAAGLTDAARREDRGAFFGSIQRTLSHLMWGDTVWMARFDGWEPPKVGIRQSPDLWPDFAPMREARIATDERIEEWAARVDAGWLGQDMTWFSGVLNREITRPNAMLVTHFFNHQTHHRGQAHTLLTAAGADTGDTDLPFVLPDAG
jgi:uncharacterized damage-inducible protein DinB